MLKRIRGGEEDRWSYIDILECIGILFVIMYHTSTYNYDCMENNHALYYIRYFFRALLSTCVPLFFFANGYLLFNRKFNLRRHLYKIVKIIFCSVIWGIIGIFMMMNIQNETLTLKEFIVDLCKLEPAGWINHLWYMEALVFLYLFFPLLRKIYETNRRLYIGIIVLFAVFTFGKTLTGYAMDFINAVIFHNNSTKYIDWIEKDGFVRKIYVFSFVYFMVGGLAYDFKKWIIKIPKFKRNMLSCVIITLNCVLFGFVGVAFSHSVGFMWDIVWNGYDTVFTFVNVIALFALSFSYNGNYSFIKLISCNTLGIFFMHNIFIQLSKTTVVQIPFFCTCIGNLIYAVGLIGICLLLSVMIGKIPFFKHLVKI